jgi:FtsP/CotA-like multicopper oxidase with cupredoxin domain
MRTLLTRRQILASGIAMVGTVSLPPMAQTAAAPESPAAKLRLSAATRTLDVNGKPARVFGLTGPNGKPGITLSPGERFRVDLVNETGTSTIVHWHGQLPPWTQDGFPCRKRRRSRRVTPFRTITRRSRARSGCIRIKACRNRA